MGLSSVFIISECCEDPNANEMNAKQIKHQSTRLSNQALVPSSYGAENDEQNKNRLTLLDRQLLTHLRVEMNARGKQDKPQELNIVPGKGNNENND